ncbi:helix-turn-helix domain-containing protein [Prauserella muralis]|uniref:DNA-binding protein n=1 Tax=Prauserella muralis TaxID=588067 RepID=A0A2V4BBV7_9PSEU|nr:helix-turn-helix domain-containing protein [Prauserella muralis]PXY27119.1 DNA-binding protein [Prauserella muralis]TWE23244.1 HTH domain-containing protein [Prauserella muralis]
MELEAEFTSEPFRGEGEPPEHAVRARQAADDAGLTTSFGPLGTSARGEADALLDALPSIARAALSGGATRLTLRLQVPGGEPAAAPAAEPGSVLARMLREVENELGRPLAGLDRPGKQRAVRLLEERGAFQLRKSVAAVADALGVTRFTVYNYLNRTSPES